MTNAEKFKQLFGIYATELWAMPEEKFLEWLNAEALEKQEQSNAQNVNSTHTSRPNALESLNILEQAKDDKGCVPMSLVRQAFRNILEKDRWIPVTERLPEKNGRYIICYEDATTFLDYFNGKWFFSLGKDITAWEETGTIIAWRPLPEPYKAAVDIMEKATHQFHSEKIDSDGWISTTKNLPHEGVRVLGCIKSIHANTPYIDVVCIKMGISKTEREQLAKTGNERAKIFTSSDEWGNNKVPYSWKTFGRIEYFGQEVVAWQPLPESYSED